MPDYAKTREHVFAIVPQQHYHLALNGGCGTRMNALALAELADKVVGVDISRQSMNTAAGLAQKTLKNNIVFNQASLLGILFKDETFDLVYSWGVIHHTVNPDQAFRELVRVLKPGGYLVLAVYLKTRLTFVPEKHFYTTEQMQRLYETHGLTFELLNPHTGRFKSTSNFIVRGQMKS
ncbi:MAG: class I SAM-dependent methyltransferase [Candidatus Schekmanbacteria bacterium]|nr:class I SAM-dependent methyltransferase [Candidatus Schekmanbacteria bacterium]